MSRYTVHYKRPGEPIAKHELEAKSDAEARIRFLNLSWVAFTEIGIEKIRPVAAKADDDFAQAVGSIPRASAKPQKASAPAVDPWAECDRLTEKIGHLGDQAQEETRKGNHAKATALRGRAKGLAEKRAEITRQNKRRR